MVYQKGHKPQNTLDLKGKKNRYFKTMSKELADAWKNRELVLLFERIALLSPSADDLKRIDQCLSGIESLEFSTEAI